jgi:hypothetical protein
MENTDDGGPAFPSTPGEGGDKGMSWLDYFAAKLIVLQPFSNLHDPRNAVARAYIIASYMLEEKKRRAKQRFGSK